jgi:hypothetical protein
LDDRARAAIYPRNVFCASTSPHKGVDCSDEKKMSNVVFSGEEEYISMEPVRPAGNSYHVSTIKCHKLALREVAGHALGEWEARDEKVVGFYVFVYRLGRLAYGLFS